jgi:hypothetical protein
MFFDPDFDPKNDPKNDPDFDPQKWLVFDPQKWPQNECFFDPKNSKSRKVISPPFFSPENQKNKNLFFCPFLTCFLTPLFPGNRRKPISLPQKWPPVLALGFRLGFATQKHHFLTQKWVQIVTFLSLFVTFWLFFDLENQTILSRNEREIRPKISFFILTVWHPEKNAQVDSFFDSFLTPKPTPKTTPKPTSKTTPKPRFLTPPFFQETEENPH